VTRVRRLARLLLFQGLPALLALWISLPMSGCIIPVAPDFQDPVSSPNYPPYLSNPSPQFGRLVTVQAGVQVAVSAFVSDPNLTDTLYYQWVYDDTTPPNPAVTHALGYFPLTQPPDGSPQQIPPVEVNCGLGLAATSTSLHQLELIVSDREPNPHPTGPFDDIPFPGYKVYGNWPLLLLCDGTSP